MFAHFLQQETGRSVRTERRTYPPRNGSDSTDKGGGLRRTKTPHPII